MPDDSKLTFTLRIHDPAEKKDAAKSTAWSVLQIPRAVLELSIDDFVAKYVKPAIAQDLAKFFTGRSAPATSPAETAASVHPAAAGATVLNMPSPSAVVPRESADSPAVPQAPASSETSEATHPKTNS